MTATLVLGEIHSGCCQLHTDAQCSFTYSVYNDVYLALASLPQILQGRRQKNYMTTELKGPVDE